MSDFIKTIILGLIEGLTEFIPVSSTGHLILTGEILKFGGEFSKTFNIAIQLGAIIAVIFVYKNNFKEYFKIKPNLKIFPNIIQIIITTIPALIFGYLFHGFIKTYLFSPVTVAVGLIIGAFLMIFADYYQKKNSKEEKITYFKSFIIGLFQCLALWPGMSRSGSTISGALITGTNHKKASSYSFICAVPIMFCATAYEMIKTKVIFNTHSITLLSIGFVISFFVAWISIIFFIKLISKIRLIPFAIYRIVLAIIILSSPMATKVAYQNKEEKKSHEIVKNNHELKHHSLDIYHL
jgi:undecaprenyl-diphosphatase